MTLFSQQEEGMINSHFPCIRDNTSLLTLLETKVFLLKGKLLVITTDFSKVKYFILMFYFCTWYIINVDNTFLRTSVIWTSGASNHL